jgi:hypothetical protein
LQGVGQLALRATLEKTQIQNDDDLLRFRAANERLTTFLPLPPPRRKRRFPPVGRKKKLSVTNTFIIITCKRCCEGEGKHGEGLGLGG